MLPRPKANPGATMMVRHHCGSIRAIRVPSIILALIFVKSQTHGQAQGVPALREGQAAPSPGEGLSEKVPLANQVILGGDFEVVDQALELLAGRPQEPSEVPGGDRRASHETRERV